MKGIVLKHHDVPTAHIAYIIGRQMRDINVVGGICMEGAVGGINPRAAEIALRNGAKIVWMPSIDAVNNSVVDKDNNTRGISNPLLAGMVRRGNPHGLLSVLRDDSVSDQAREVMALVKEHSAIIATGHMGPKERISFMREAVTMGLSKVLITHVNASWSYCSIEEQRELVGMGAYLEYTFLPLLSQIDNQDPSLVAEMLKAVGCERAILGTDLGASWAARGVALPHPVEGMAAFIGALSNAGVTDSDINKIASRNASELLGI